MVNMILSLGTDFLNLGRQRLPNPLLPALSWEDGKRGKVGGWWWKDNLYADTLNLLEKGADIHEPEPPPGIPRKHANS